MPDIERFLEPIAGENPCGSDLRYEIYDQVEEARRREDPEIIAKMDLGREAKSSDYLKVIKLVEPALATKSKDLQLAAWLAEAWTYRDKLKGLISGLALMKELTSRFWESIYPEIEDGDDEMRARPFNWVGSSQDFIFAVKISPLTEKRRITWAAYQNARAIGTEEEASSDQKKASARKLAKQTNKVLIEDFEKEFDLTNKEFYRTLCGECNQAKEALTALDELCKEKFKDSPSFGTLRDTLAEISRGLEHLFKRKLEKDPDPIEQVPSTEETAQGASASEAEIPIAGPNGVVAGFHFDPAQLEGGEITSAEQAVLHTIAAAQFLRRRSPASPVSYLLLRALRWGELRSSGNLEQADLPAPPSEIRVQLRSAMAAKNWARVLDTAEIAMCSPSGRGWLDIQRYAITACDQLGYESASKALRAELRTILLDFPNLPSATLNDDTGTANPETLAWLRKEGLLS